MIDHDRGRAQPQKSDKNLNNGCVKFRIKSWTKYQIKCLKMIFKMTLEFLSRNKSEQIINKICLFILYKFKKI